MTGSITLTRHGEPALSRKAMLNAAEYDTWWARYEVGGLLPGQTAPEPLLASARNAAVIVSSVRRRAVESVGMVAAGRPVISEAVFVEAPLPAPKLPGWLRLPPRQWGVLTRFTWWFFNLHYDQESQAAANIRAERAADRLVELASGGDVLLLAHGFFNTMIARALRRRGWRYAENQGWKYWTMKRFDPPLGA